ncbi:hypothetical protein B0H10DRAFT_2218947 [Mycena sp. CBHHK59/15]|nr:hypothetical protein B0H10DRAFT_2218947 [Mycena sp. CBHHK59/15]
MVVTRRTPVAPVPTGSRTNSTAPVPRAGKAKSSLSAESEPAAESRGAGESQTAASKNAASSQKPPSKSKHKNRHHKKTPKRSNSLLDYLVYLSLLFLGVYALSVCPHDHALANPLCRSLSQYRAHVLEPYVLPPIHKALAHPAVAPYVAHAQRLERTAAPYAAAAKRAVWDRALVPSYNLYVVPQWRARVLPPWRRHAGPYLDKAAPHLRTAQRVLSDTAATLHQAYAQYVHPAALRVYIITKPHAVRAYTLAKPHAIAAGAQARVAGARLAVKAGEVRRAYVDPHVVRIWAKVLELSGAGPVGSATEQVPEEPATTKATSEEPTKAAKPTTAVVEPVMTPVEVVSSSSSAAPAEEVAATVLQSSSSSVTAVDAEKTPSAEKVAAPSAETVAVPSAEVVAAPSAETASPSASSSSAVSVPAETTSSAETTPPAAETVLSAASVVAEYAHGAESAVVVEIVADAVAAAEDAATEEVTSATVSEDATSAADVTTAPTPTLSADTASPVDTLLSGASVAAESAHAMESELAEAFAEELDAEEDMDDFYSALGLVDKQAPAEEEEEIDDLTPIERARLQQQEAEERAAAAERKTAEKRADLMARMARSSETLGVMVKDKNKQLRKALVAIRKGAVAQIENPQSAVGGVLPALGREADKLLKGLEGYLRKEAKVNKGGDPVERTERWEKVVGKVEEKLTEAIQAAQGAVHQFHVDVKAEEVNEGMAIIQQVKDAASQAQGDVGLDLSWLEDVTWMDWQVYHDLARIGEKFQAEASEIQAGTHTSPPVDPFVPRIEKMNAEIAEMVQGYVGRLAKLKQQAGALFAGVAASPPPPPPTEADAADPQVSILPVDAVPGTPKDEDFDAAQVVIGKSKKQVEEALRKVVLEPEPAEL